MDATLCVRSSLSSVCPPDARIAVQRRGSSCSYKLQDMTGLGQATSMSAACGRERQIHVWTRLCLVLKDRAGPCGQGDRTSFTAVGKLATDRA